jgi:hypothetical protein
VLAEKILAELGAFDDEGAFPCADFFIPEKTSDQIGLRARQGRQRRTHVSLCSNHLKRNPSG